MTDIQTVTILPYTAVVPNAAATTMTPDQMAILWHGEFDNLFSQLFPCSWGLSPVSVYPAPPDHVIANRFEYRDSAKVRFLCRKCCQGWTSMKGCVYFWCFLDVCGNGLVLFELLGQKCQKCNENRFEMPLWYPEEVLKVLKNLYNRICHTFYGLVVGPYEKKRRPGKPRSQHPKDLCQACQRGFCTRRDN